MMVCWRYLVTVSKHCCAVVKLTLPEKHQNKAEYNNLPGSELHHFRVDTVRKKKICF